MSVFHNEIQPKLKCYGPWVHREFAFKWTRNEQYVNAATNVLLVSDLVCLWVLEPYLVPYHPQVKTRGDHCEVTCGSDTGPFFKLMVI